MRDLRRRQCLAVAGAGLVHWAGEHHKSRDQGAEAALQSGERTATALLGELRPDRTPTPSKHSVAVPASAQPTQEKPQ